MLKTGPKMYRAAPGIILTNITPIRCVFDLFKDKMCLFWRNYTHFPKAQKRFWNVVFLDKN